MSKKLYQITDTVQRKAVTGLYFADKVSAKAARAELNAKHQTELRFVVSPGPDHKHFAK